jgi:pyrimidine-specific ribonucleoside hydrolase
MKAKRHLRPFRIILAILSGLLILLVPACNLPVFSAAFTPTSNSQPAQTSPDVPMNTGSAPTVALTQSSSERIPVVVDDDGSPDGVLALLYFLNNPAYNVLAATVSYGEAHPAVYAQNLVCFLSRIGRTDVPVAAGRETPLEGNNAFPDSWRDGSDQFWGMELPDAAVDVQPMTAPELLIQVIRQSSRPVLVFVSGSQTNLAEVLRLDADISGNIRDVAVMGGTIYEPGNIAAEAAGYTNTVAEWNIWVDPTAASEVFSSGLHISLMPLDATNQVLFTEEDAAAWASSRSPIGLAALDLLHVMLGLNPQGTYGWDLVAAINSTEPHLCSSVDLSLQVITDAGTEEARTAIQENMPANTSVCLKPDAEGMRAQAALILKGE